MLLLLLAGCAALPHPTPDDARRAQSLYPGTTVEDLEAGRSRFVQDCSGCHSLPLPSDKAPLDWPFVVDEMAGKFTLSTQDQAVITRFLVTLSQPHNP